MIAILKRYGAALGFLLLVVIIMLVGTMGVTMFGEKMISEIGEESMKPRGEKLIK